MRRTRRMMHFTNRLLVAWLGAVLVPPALAQLPVVLAPTHTLQHPLNVLGSDGSFHDRFGAAVAIDGDRIVVGARGDAVAGRPDGDGSAYVFERNGGAWVLQAKLTASDRAGGDRFGRSVAISGDRIIVGADLADLPNLPNAGAAYVYERDASGDWIETVKLTAQPAQADARFGTAVALDAQWALIGAAFEDVDGIANAGAAYTFPTASWSGPNRLTLAPGEIDSEARFGTAVALAASVAVIGASGDVVAGVRGGSASVLLFDGAWSQQALLANPDAANSDAFGFSVATSETGNQLTVMVGAHGDDVDGKANQGSATVFRRIAGVWNAPVRLVAADGVAGDAFGSAVAIAGATFVVGAPTRNGQQGGTYFWRDSAGGLVADSSIPVTTSGPNQRSGDALAVSADWLLVGAPAAGEIQAGVVAVFERDGETWTSSPPLTTGVGARAGHLAAAIAVTTDWIVAGAEHEGPGAVYVFPRAGTSIGPPIRLQPSDLAAAARFGTAVAIDGSVIVVGAEVDGGDVQTGTAHVFRWDGASWEREATLMASDGLAFDLFGHAVAIDDDRIVIGAPLAPYFWPDGAQTTDQGAAYVFERSSGVWMQTGKLTDDETVDQFLGEAVDLDGDTIVLGASNAATGTTLHGAAHVYTLDAGKWTHATRLVAGDVSSGQMFGAAVRLHGHMLAIGAPRDGSWIDQEQGAVYLFVHSGAEWIEAAKLSPDSPGAKGWFGSALDLSDGSIVIGEPSHADVVADGGRAHVFRSVDGKWIADVVLVDPDVAAGYRVGQAVAVLGDACLVGAPERVASTIYGNPYDGGMLLFDHAVPSYQIFADSFE